MSGVIVKALRQALGGLLKSSGGSETKDRTDQDMSYSTMLLIGLLTAIALLIYFRYAVVAGMADPWRLAIISVAAAMVVTFIFTTVSAWAIAVISTTRSRE